MSRWISRQDLALAVPLVLGVGYLAKRYLWDDKSEGKGNDAEVPTQNPPEASRASGSGAGSGESAAFNSDSESEEDTESPEDKAFSAACNYVAMNSSSFPNDKLLEMYALFKQATSGPCTSSRPSVLRQVARAKWDSWKALGDLAADEAKAKYVAIVSESNPEAIPRPEAGEGARPQRSLNVSQPQSTLMNVGVEDTVHDIFWAVGEGKAAIVARYVEGGGDVTARNDYGETLLHCAADSGHLNLVAMLLQAGADPNAVEPETKGTPLHYAVLAERGDVAAALVKAGADVNVLDEDGVSPLASATEAVRTAMTGAM